VFGPAHALPEPDRDGALAGTLAARRTTRAFDTAASMGAEDLSTVLHLVFGCHGHGTTPMGAPCIKRTSPSGGGLHPVEAYPLLTGVAGLATGLHHYNVRDHTLELIEALDPAAARSTATMFMCGQSYFGAAHMSIVLTARFHRSHWKYRAHDKAYAGILMDAAHLSQTLFLVATDLGLGAFVTLAVNGGDAEQRIGLDGYAEGVIAMVGCGVPAPGGSPLELNFAPGRPSVAGDGVNE
jgi:putative peptide maturation dehydrogenase